MLEVARDTYRAKAAESIALVTQLRIRVSELERIVRSQEQVIAQQEREQNDSLSFAQEMALVKNAQIRNLRQQLDSPTHSPTHSPSFQRGRSSDELDLVGEEEEEEEELFGGGGSGNGYTDEELWSRKELIAEIVSLRREVRKEERRGNALSDEVVSLRESLYLAGKASSPARAASASSQVGSTMLIQLAQENRALRDSCLELEHALQEAQSRERDGGRWDGGLGGSMELRERERQSGASDSDGGDRDGRIELLETRNLALLKQIHALRESLDQAEASKAPAPGSPGSAAVSAGPLEKSMSKKWRDALEQEKKERFRLERKLSSLKGVVRSLRQELHDLKSTLATLRATL